MPVRGSWNETYPNIEWAEENYCPVSEDPWILPYHRSSPNEENPLSLNFLPGTCFLGNLGQEMGSVCINYMPTVCVCGRKGCLVWHAWLEAINGWP